MSVHKARADAIELNRQQANTQERLQRIIAQKDEELKRIRAIGAGTGTAALGAAGVAGTAGLAAANSDATEAKIANLSAKRDAWESERARLIDGLSDDQATVAIDPADLHAEALSEQLDQTVSIDAEQLADLKNRAAHEKTQALTDDDADKTLTLEEDQTMLLDNLNSKNKTPGGTPNNNDD